MRVGQSRKRDSNEAEIVRALRQAGASVFKLSQAGCPDLLCLTRTKQVVLLEVKSARGHATPSQQKAAQLGWPVVTVRSWREALTAIGCEVRTATDVASSVLSRLTNTTSVVKV